MTYRYVNRDLDFRLVNLDDDWRLVDARSRLPPDFPTTPSPIAISVTSVSPTYVSITHSLRRQARSRGAHAWQIDMAFGAMTRATFAPLWSFLNSQAGQSGTFTFSLPSLGTPRGTAAGTPLVNGGAQIGSELVTDGWAINSLVLRKGDFIEIDGDRKIYQITADATSNGSGEVTLSLYPALRRTPPDNVTVHTDVVFTCALTSDALQANWDHCTNARGFELSLIEVQQ